MATVDADEQMFRALKALADATRFRMVQEIGASGELNCSQVAERFDVTQPTISHHMKVLADAGILVVRTEGKHHLVRVDHAVLEAILGHMARRIAPSERNGKSKAAPGKAAR